MSGKPGVSRWIMAGCLVALLPAMQAQQLASAPDPQTGSLFQAQSLADGGEFVQAENMVRVYLTTHNDSAEAHSLLGYVLFRKDKPLESLAEYTKAAAIRKPDAQQLRIVALDYVLANDYSDAGAWMARASTWAPGDSEIWYDLGRIRNVQGNFAEGAECLTHSLALSPRSVKAETNLGLSYAGLGRLEDAIAAYRQAVAWQQASDHPSEQPLLDLGQALIDAGRPAEAAGPLEQAAAIAPANAMVREALGRLYARQGNIAQAQAALEKAVSLEPNNAAYHFQLGQAYRNNHEAEKARAQFAEAARLQQGSIAR